MIADPRLHQFMKKVRIGIDPKAQAAKREDRRTYAARVTVSARGRSYVRETLYARGTPVAGFEMSDDELSNKLRDAAAGLLSDKAVESALQTVWHLEKCPDVSELLEFLVP